MVYKLGAQGSDLEIFSSASESWGSRCQMWRVGVQYGNQTLQ